MAVFSWGLGKSGQLGNGKLTNAELPQTLVIEKSSSLEKIDSIVGISAGGLFSCFITRSGKVLSCGNGKYGRLGSNKEEDQKEACLVKDLTGVKVVQVSCGLWHGCAIDSDGVLYSWGYDKSHGVLGHGDLPPSTFRPPLPVKFLSGIRMVGVSCGNNFTLAWDESGVAYSWGFGKYGVLGHGSEEDHVTPAVIDKLSGHKVIHMDAGFSHCSAVTAERKLFMFGQGKYGALGLGQKNLGDHHIPTQVPGMDGVVFKEASCSNGEHHGHTLALSDKGMVYAFGDGYKGKLGLGDQESRFTFIQIPQEHFQNEAITHVSCGGIHSSALSVSGHVFTWGCGSDGRLGHPEAAGHRYLFRSDVPRMVDYLDKIGKATQVAASYYHTVALVEPN